MIKKLTILLFALILSTGLIGQVKISGNVKDAQTGQTIPGVSIIEKGTYNGCVSDINGDYSIIINDVSSATLVFSFVGYTTEERKLSKGQLIVDVVLNEEVQNLEGVVVTALGITQAKKSVGYSTQEVRTEDIKKIAAPNVGNLLTGKVAGLAVNNPTGMFQSPTFSLRGKSPLIVVNNVPVETNMFDIASEDIENITVLKGTSASALYGARGRNGAILITTKTADVTGTEVTISNNTMLTVGYASFPQTQSEYGNGSYGQYEFWDGKDGGKSDGDMIWGPKFGTGIMVPQWNSPIYDSLTGETIPWWGDVEGTKYNDKSRYSRVPIPWEYHDNLRNFMRTGVVTTSNFSVAHKGNRFMYRMSGNYSYQRGQVPNTCLYTGSLNFSSTSKLTQALTLDTKLSYGKVYSPNYPRYGYGPRNHMYTILIWMGDDVNGEELKEHLYVPGQEGYRQANFNYAWYNNVYFAAYELSQMYNENGVNGQLRLSYEINRNLILQAKTSLITKHLFEDRKSPKSYLNYGDPRDGDYKIWNTDWLTADNDILLTYRQPVNENINLTFNAGAASYYSRYSQEYNATDGLIVPWVYSLNNTKNSVKASNYLRERAVNSVYLTADIDLYDIFFLKLAARNDWSSTLPVHHNSYFYPSVSLSTVLSNMITMPVFVDYLKLYGSWANVSSDLNPYQISSYYYNAGNYGSTTMVDYSGAIINPNIKPESSTSYEAGLSSSFLKNTLTLDLTWYRVIDKNQIIDLPISPTSGFNSHKVNGNEFTTNGIEITLGATPIKSSSARWDIALGFDTRVKRITEIYGDAKKYGNYSLNERVDNYYATAWMKSPDGKVILDKGSGLPIRDPYPQLFGHLEPDFRFGFQNNITFGKFVVGVDFDGVYGGIFHSRSLERMWWGGKHPGTTKYRDEEYAAGHPVYVPDGVNIVSGELVRDVDGNVISDTRVFEQNTTAVDWQSWCQNYPFRARVTEKENKEFVNTPSRTFFKLRKVSLTYDATNLLNLRTIKHIEITAFGYNLFVLKKAKIVDPDYGNDDNLQDPSARYLGLGFKINL
ncbi:MAG: SusC/RagA family TonB-linked outer membrane protein [Lentimicrobiaceae bacterium]|nr:SusC/RagA family TonB-linked outer membrane protein [Lentimicrobiaceae bacterium]